MLYHYVQPVTNDLNARARLVDKITNKNYPKWAAINLYDDTEEAQLKVIQSRFEKVADPLLKVFDQIKLRYHIFINT